MTKDVPSYYDSERRDLIDLLPKSAEKILDVGCGAAATWKDREKLGLEVWGIEVVAKAAAAARPRLTRLIESDVEKLDAGILPLAYFDVIFLADVLEHLIDPWGFLTGVVRSLKSETGSCVIASIPNLRHYRVLKRLLLRGRFRYADSGVLDRTHLRFFCRADVVELFTQAGLRVDVLRGKSSASRTARILNFCCLGLFNDFLVEQYQLVARKLPA